MKRPEPQSLLAAIILSGCTCSGSLPGRRAVRPPEHAGHWYERDPQKLTAQLEQFVALARSEPEPVQAVLVPHAGYEWAGQVVGRTLGALREKRYRRIVVVGQSHASTYPGAALPAEGGFETPIGTLAIDEPAVELLAGYPGFARRAIAYDGDYGIEVLLPFVRHLWPEARLVTVMLGQLEPERLAEVGAVLRNVLDEETLLVASTTMTHFGFGDGPEPFELGGGREKVAEALRAFERPVVEAMLARDPAAVLSISRGSRMQACGMEALIALLHAIGEGAAAKIAAYGSTLDREFDPDDPGGISYLGILFPGRFPAVPELGESERRLLGELAWNAVSAGVHGRACELPDDLPPRLRQPGGAFVSVHLHGQLRGCMGLLASESLAKAVVHAGTMAVSEDPRFNPLRPEQLSLVDLEVSALGPFVPIDGADDYEPGRHGLLLTHGFHRGLLLPQVATEHGLGRIEFLEALAQKAGMRADRWSEGDLQRFGAFVFSPKRGS